MDPLDRDGASNKVLLKVIAFPKTLTGKADKRGQSINAYNIVL